MPVSKALPDSAGAREVFVSGKLEANVEAAAPSWALWTPTPQRPRDAEAASEHLEIMAIQLPSAGVTAMHSQGKRTNVPLPQGSLPDSTPTAGCCAHSVGTANMSAGKLGSTGLEEW